MCRPTKVTRGVLQHSDTVGSSLVRLGNTLVVCGISLQIGTPTRSASSHCGDVLVQVIPPPNNPNANANTSTSLSQQGLEDDALQSILMDSLDLTCLSIVPGQAAWRIQVTIQVLQDHGNVWDATLMAAVSAMTQARLPPTQGAKTTTATTRGRNAGGIQGSRLEILPSPSTHMDSDKTNDTTKPLIFKYLPVPLTVGVYPSSTNDDSIHLLADPTPEEATVLLGYLTMVVTDDNEIVYTRLASKVGLTRQDLAVAAQMAHGRGKEIRSSWEDA